MLKVNIPRVDEPVFSTELEVRIYDVNYGNHLGHDSFVSLIHEARMRFLRSLGYSSEKDFEGLGVLVTSLAVNYLGQAFYGDSIVIDIGVGESTMTSFQLIYQMKNRDAEIASAMTTITMFDYNLQRVAKIPQKLLQVLSM